MAAQTTAVSSKSSLPWSDLLFISMREHKLALRMLVNTSRNRIIEASFLPGMKEGTTDLF